MIDPLAQEALKSWARTSLQYFEQTQGKAWRGTQEWPGGYEKACKRWLKQGHRGRPAAFQDGIARPEQLLPGTPGASGAIYGSSSLQGKERRPVEDPDDWVYWLLRSGRGWGKTVTGAQTILEWARQGLTPLLAAGATATDVRDTMVEAGESSILKIAPPDFRPLYEPSKLRLTFPNGVIVQLRSAEDPERWRGIQFVKAWLDELASWRRLSEVWEQIRYVMRVKRKSSPVQLVITTTPRPTPVVRFLSQHPRCALVVRSSHDNLDNLAGEFAAQIGEVEFTRKGQQEVHGELLEDVEGALWREKQIDAVRVTPDQVPELDRIIVGVDPPGGSTEAGIVVAGRTRHCPQRREGCRGHAYILDDVSIGGPPAIWAHSACQAYHNWEADKLVAEINYGGDMVSHTIATEDDTVAFKTVHASRGKKIRAEPISNLYEGEHPRVHHVGTFGPLETEMTQWTPEDAESPNRLDAMVWAVTELMLGHAMAMPHPPTVIVSGRMVG